MQDRLWRFNVQEPSPIQKLAIPYLLQEGDVAIQSYTGSGKVNGRLNGAACGSPCRALVGRTVDGCWCLVLDDFLLAVIYVWRCGLLDSKSLSKS